jgi:hypothetical protein
MTVTAIRAGIGMHEDENLTGGELLLRTLLELLDCAHAPYAFTSCSSASCVSAVLGNIVHLRKGARIDLRQVMSVGFYIGFSDDNRTTDFKVAAE